MLISLLLRPLANPWTVFSLLPRLLGSWLALIFHIPNLFQFGLLYNVRMRFNLFYFQCCLHGVFDFKETMWCLVETSIRATCLLACYRACILWFNHSNLCGPTKLFFATEVVRNKTKQILSVICYLATKHNAYLAEEGVAGRQTKSTTGNKNQPQSTTHQTNLFIKLG